MTGGGGGSGEVATWGVAVVAGLAVAGSAAVAVVARAEGAEVGGGGVAAAVVVGAAGVALPGVASSARRGLVRGWLRWVGLTLRFGRSEAGVAAAE